MREGQNIYSIILNKKTVCYTPDCNAFDNKLQELISSKNLKPTNTARSYGNDKGDKMITDCRFVEY